MKTSLMRSTRLLATTALLVLPAPFARVVVAYGRMDPPDFRREVMDRASTDLRRAMEALAARLLTRGG